MIIKKVLILTLFLTALSAARPLFCSDKKNDFQWYGELKGNYGREQLCLVPLDEKLLMEAREDLSDIRLYTDQNREVPYVIISDVRPDQGIVKKTYDLKVIDFKESDTGETVTAELPEKSEPVRRLFFNISERDFKKEIVIFSGADLQMWEEIARGSIYDFSSRVNLRKTHVDIPATNEKFIRIEVIEASPQTNKGIEEAVELKYKDLQLNVTNLPKKHIRINAITASTKKETRASEKNQASRSYRDFTQTVTSENVSLIGFSCGLLVEKIRLQTEASALFRDVTVFEGKDEKECLENYEKKRPCARGSIWHPIEGEDSKIRDTVDVKPGKYRYVLLVIDNKDNPPLEVSEITVYWTWKNLFFIAPDAQAIQLYFGNEASEKPQYDLKHFVNAGNWYQKDFKALTLSDIKENKTHIPKPTREEQEKLRKMIITMVTFIMVGILGVWLYFLTRSMGKNK